MPDISVVLVRPRFPENIGMAARACANMGIEKLVLVNPERWVYAKAAPLATGKGLVILDSARHVPTLAQALTEFTTAFGMTARTGGWRSGVLTPKKAAAVIASKLADPETVERIALVFGPEDRGLENAEVGLCSHLVTIPTAPDASSLNLAQSVLLVAYECFNASLEHTYHPDRTPKGRKRSRTTTLEEQEFLFKTLQKTLIQIEFLPNNNAEWFMQPLRRFFRRASIQRHEFDLLMGICRRILRLAQKQHTP